MGISGITMDVDQEMVHQVVSTLQLLFHLWFYCDALILPNGVFRINYFVDVENLFVTWQGSVVEEFPQLHEVAQQDQQQLDRAHMAESGATVVTFAEAEASRKNIQEFLKHHCAYELLPESGKVWFFSLMHFLCYAHLS